MYVRRVSVRSCLQRSMIRSAKNQGAIIPILDSLCYMKLLGRHKYDQELVLAAEEQWCNFLKRASWSTRKECNRLCGHGVTGPRLATTDLFSFFQPCPASSASYLTRSCTDYACHVLRFTRAHTCSRKHWHLVAVFSRILSHECWLGLTLFFMSLHISSSLNT